MQRLFSTFAGGWPGAGLLIQRLVIGTIFLRGAFLELSTNPHIAVTVLQLIASLLLIIGLGTPYVGVLAAATQLWLFFSGVADRWTTLIICGLGLSLAMIGPGAWSMDARFFGRKHIEIVNK